MLRPKSLYKDDEKVLVLDLRMWWFALLGVFLAAKEVRFVRMVCGRVKEICPTNR